MILCVVFHTHIQMTPVVFANGGPFPCPQCHLVMYQAPVEAWDFLSVCPWACPTLVAGLDIGGDSPPFVLSDEVRADLDFGVSVSISESVY